MIRIRIQIEFRQIDCKKRGEAQWDKVQVVWRAMETETEGTSSQVTDARRPAAIGPAAGSSGALPRLENHSVV